MKAVYNVKGYLPKNNFVIDENVAVDYEGGATEAVNLVQAEWDRRTRNSGPVILQSCVPVCELMESIKK